MKCTFLRTSNIVRMCFRILWDWRISGFFFLLFFFRVFLDIQCLKPFVYMTEIVRRIPSLFELLVVLFLKKKKR